MDRYVYSDPLFSRFWREFHECTDTFSALLYVLNKPSAYLISDAALKLIQSEIVDQIKKEKNNN